MDNAKRLDRWIGDNPTTKLQEIMRHAHAIDPQVALHVKYENHTTFVEFTFTDWSIAQVALLD